MTILSLFLAIAFADSCPLPQPKCSYYTSTTQLTKHQIIDLGREKTTTLCVDDLKFDRHDLHEMASAGVKLDISLKKTHFDRLALQSIALTKPLRLSVNSDEISKSDFQVMGTAINKSFFLDEVKISKADLLQLIDDQTQIILRRSDDRFSEAEINELASKTQKLIIVDDKSESLSEAIYKNNKIEVEKCMAHVAPAPQSATQEAAPASTASE